ncbi:hypothetical protein [Flavobacterium sp. FlaQc-47]|uniref:hypothetical protein n=1 Tax=Flavobacterium sp. FlaQc-47 TaxID=3374180 RepID=UPI00375789F9
MIKILKYLILIRFRKILPKDDYVAIGLFLLFYVGVFYFLNKLFPQYPYLFLFSSVELIIYHRNREDLDLLKFGKNFKILLFIEYLIYSFPFILIYLLNKRWDILLIHISTLMLLIVIKKRDFKIISYPFKLFDPFWHICFRKDKLLIFIPLVIFLNILGNEYHNENLNISTLLIITIIVCLPSFKREKLIYLKVSPFDSKTYLRKQIQVGLLNTSMISFVLLVCLILFKQWNLLLFMPLVFIFSVVSVLFKYSFFSNPLLQQIFFIFFIGTAQFGLPFLMIPFLYYKSVKTINEVNNVKN